MGGSLEFCFVHDIQMKVLFSVGSFSYLTNVGAKKGWTFLPMNLIFKVADANRSLIRL